MSHSKISSTVRNSVKKSAKNRCGYCLAPQRLIMARLEIEHIQPISKGGTDDEENLWLACPFCNAHKSDKTEATDPISKQTVKLFNPRNQIWSEHFEWSEDGAKVIGKTPIGRATVIALALDSDDDAIETRKAWVSVAWFPPKD